MIRVRSYNDYFAAMLQKVPAIKSFLLVANESDLSKTIMNMPGSKFPVLIAVIPSGDSIAADSDNILESNTCLLYVLKKIDPTSATPATFLFDMELTQDIISSIKVAMANDKANHVVPHLLHKLDLNKMHTDPEYNYLGCNGWSLSFNLLTPGF